MLASTVTAILFITAAYHNLLCSIVLRNIINTVSIIMPELIPVKYQSIQTDRSSTS